MGTINMFQLPCSPPQNFLPWFFFSLHPIIFFSDPDPSLSLFPPSPLCHPLLVVPPPPGRAGQSVSRRGPPVPYSSDSHLGRVSSRQPGPVGTVGAGQAFPGEPQNVNTLMKFPHFSLSWRNVFTLYTQLSLTTQFIICYCSASVIVDRSDRKYESVLSYMHHFSLRQLMFSRPYSRKLEAEADQVGLQLAAKVSSSPVCYYLKARTDFTHERRSTRHPEKSFRFFLVCFSLRLSVFLWPVEIYPMMSSAFSLLGF